MSVSVALTEAFNCNDEQVTEMLGIIKRFRHQQDLSQEMVPRPHQEEILGEAHL